MLSLWKVDDDATALLMSRFYRELAWPTRPALTKPMPKSEALAEARSWLRTSTRDEVGKALASISRGEIVRRKVVGAGEPDRPFADPTFWAAFILTGSPD